MKVVWKLSVGVGDEAEEAVSEMLERDFASGATSYRDAQTGRTTVSVFLKRKPSLDEKGRVTAALQRIASEGLAIGHPSVRRVSNWAESWKRHFKPIEIGSSLLIIPSWSRRHARREQELITLDPGLSFGTGQHATTSFCLREIVARRRVGGAFLDLGTGSGILAISAARLGYEPVDALDFDKDAVRIARENARQNQARVNICNADVLRLPIRSAQKYTLICANLISNVLIAARERIVARLASGGALVLAGILASEFHEVRDAYEALGVRLLRARTEKEWRSGTFVTRKT